MKTLIFDVLSISAVLIPTVLILFFFPISFYLKKNTREIIKSTDGNDGIEFLRRSPKLLKIWLHKDLKGQRALFSRLFFSYNKEDKQFHGQAVFKNRKLVDIKYYPPEYQDPNGKFPILSANDEIAAATEKQNDSNIVPFPKKD